MANRSPNNQTEPSDPIDEAWRDTVEKVSIAGWKEALDEQVSLSRSGFRTALLIFTVLCVYDGYPVIRRWAIKEYTNDISDVLYPDSVPFSNVTICTPAYLNPAFVKEHIQISERLAESYRRQTNESIDELYEQLAIFLSLTAKPKVFGSTHLAFFQRIVRSNRILDEHVEFLYRATVQCEDVLKRCWFSGVEFDCCANAVGSIGDDGMCYQLYLNSDSDNAFPSNGTFRQTKPGPNGGLIVEASMSMNETAWIDELASNGFIIFVNSVPYSGFQSPLGVSSRAVSYIRVHPSRRQLTQRCVGRGEMNKRQPFMYYDPEGFDCIVEAFVRGVGQKYLNCDSPLYLFKPNVSTVCSFDTRYLSMVIFSSARTGAAFIDMNGTKGTSDAALLAKAESDMRAALRETSACPKHCTRWTYDSGSSFYYLEPPDNSSLLSDPNRLFSRIHVFYDDMSFRQYDEVLSYPSYLAFCDLGNVIGLYWGMSIVSVIHFFYYVPRYLFVSRHRRGVRRRVPWRGNRVSDVVVHNSWV